uniref:AAA+ ATPase domain-containing protein n=1 Tax=Erythrolobus australicus TaxID=1077150 RepID=A0A7S1TKA4_9RHOD
MATGSESCLSPVWSVGRSPGGGLLGRLGVTGVRLPDMLDRVALLRAPAAPQYARDGARSDADGEALSADVPMGALVFNQLVASGVGLLLSWIAARIMRRMFAPPAKPDETQSAVVARLIKGGVPRERLKGMTSAELTMSCELVFPEEVSTRFRDIGGHDSLKKELRELVILPLRAPSLFSSHELLRPPKGVMLYGPPGTGKTMLVRALAKESGAQFLNLSPSSLLSKWVGETNRLVHAVFSLAARVAPCVVFVDEMDALFRARSAGDHEVYRDMKAEFCQLWDGLLSDSTSQVMLIGATNRPWDIDTAILRRMPRAFLVDLPDAAQRTGVLRAVLRTSKVDPEFDYDRIASLTEGYSGSDLSELSRAAFQAPMQEALDRRLSTLEGHSVSQVAPVRPSQELSVRPLRTDDMIHALKIVAPTAQQSMEYRDLLASREAARAGPRSGTHDLEELLSQSLYRDPFSDGYHQASM